MCLSARSRKGHLQFFMKEYDKALETYEAGLKHDPDNSELKEGIARCFEAINKVRATSVCLGYGCDMQAANSCAVRRHAF